MPEIARLRRTHARRLCFNEAPRLSEEVVAASMKAALIGAGNIARPRTSVVPSDPALLQ